VYFFVENPKNPRLASFELSTEDGFLLFSKLSLRDGMNNYPHCFPTAAKLKAKLREYQNQDPIEFGEEDLKPIIWGLSDWEWAIEDWEREKKEREKNQDVEQMDE